MPLNVTKGPRPITTTRGELMYRTEERVYVDDTPALGRGKRLLYPEGVLIPISRAVALGLIEAPAPEVSDADETETPAPDPESETEPEVKPQRGERVARTAKVSQPDT